MADRVFQRVPIHLIDDWLRCGWMVLPPNAPMHHHLYGVLMEWRCVCKIPRPR